MEKLRRQKLDGEGLDRAYGMIDRQVSHLTRLVDDLLDVSRITRGLVELARSRSTSLRSPSRRWRWPRPQSRAAATI